MTDWEAAARVCSSGREVRPGNAGPNSRTPTWAELATFRERNGSPSEYKDKVTGNFTGTTSEIIQWAAHKWGVDEDLMRAVAVYESYWDAWTAGDQGRSFGLFQIRSDSAQGTSPLSRLSSAFNADYYAMTLRYYYDGRATWLNDGCCYSGWWYGPGDMWGAVGAWAQGRWHNGGAEAYIRVVRDRLWARTWEQSGF